MDRLFRVVILPSLLSTLFLAGCGGSSSTDRTPDAFAFTDQADVTLCSRPLSYRSLSQILHRRIW